MSIAKTIQSLAQLGELILQFDADLQNAITQAYHHNKWFTEANSKRALTAMADYFLNESKLKNWTDKYSGLKELNPGKTIGIVAAGNIPLVGFHDLLCVLLTPYSVKLKLSEKDKILLPFLLHQLKKIDSELADRVEIIERLNQFDAVIATGSNNTARYFEYYFGKYPSIIRKNRNSIAILTGTETKEELMLLGDDMLAYFGLGCRNVSKLYVPAGFDFQPLKEALLVYKDIMEHYHYRNNLDYNRTLLMMNNIPFLNIDFVNLIENQSIASAISNVHYQYYDDVELVAKEVLSHLDELQCIVGNVSQVSSIPFGTAQQPDLKDYADHVDTLQFLMKL
jgi:hypothetical protein